MKLRIKRSCVNMAIGIVALGTTTTFFPKSVRALTEFEVDLMKYENCKKNNRWRVVSNYYNFNWEKYDKSSRKPEFERNFHNSCVRTMNEKYDWSYL